MNASNLPTFDLRKTILGILTAVSLSAIALYLVLNHFGLNETLFRILASLPLPYVFAIAIILAIAWLADAYRYRELAEAFDTPVSLKLALLTILAGNFSINITPFYMGAGLIHVYVLVRRGLDLSKATAAIAGGAIISHTTQALLGLAALAFSNTWQITGSSVLASERLLSVIIAYLAAILALSAAAYFIRDPGKLFGFVARQKRLEKLADGLFSFHRGLNMLLRGNPWRLLRIFLFTAIYLGGVYGITPLILAGLGAAQPIGQVVSFQMLLYFAASLAPTPGSSGAIELGAFSLFTLIVPSVVLGKFVVWWRIITFYTHVALGASPFAYLLISRRWHIRR